MPDGISIAICCYNAASRLPETLSHLLSQPVPSDIEWEVVVIDNASTDGTAEAATGSWPADAPAPLRIIREPRAGVSYARERAFAEARFGTVSFIDDDNWVCPDWVRRVADVMNRYPRVGACGGRGIPAYEVAPPSWFAQYHDHFALGPQGEGSGVLSGKNGHLWGAGMSVRKAAWCRLRQGGFSYSMASRQGTQLGAGEDLELSYALILTGWDLYYDPDLTYQHFMPARRLNWSYVRRLKRGFGASSIGLDPYQCAIEGCMERYTGRLLHTWVKETYWEARKLAGDYRALLSPPRSPGEGDPRLMQIEFRRGRLAELLRGPRIYSQRFQSVLNARWMRLVDG